MVRPILALGRLIFLESEGKVGYRHGDDGAELVRIVAFLTEYAVVDRIICHLKLTFVA